LVPRPLAVAAALFACGCNEIRYQAARLRASSPKLEVPKVASLPNRRLTYTCGDGEPFDVFFPPGGAGAVLSLGGDDFALRETSTITGRRYEDGRYELYLKENGAVDLSLEDKRIRKDCKPR
jgi:membrane-bound inhibitor of C-type lysozyme